jgi:hypothetical protein
MLAPIVSRSATQREGIHYGGNAQRMTYTKRIYVAETKYR